MQKHLNTLTFSDLGAQMVSVTDYVHFRDFVPEAFFFLPDIFNQKFPFFSKPYPEILELEILSRNCKS